MSQAGEVAGHAAQICIGALAFASGAAAGMSAVTVSLASLAALGISGRMSSRRNSCKAATEVTLAALRSSQDFTDDALSRAAHLLENRTHRIKLDPSALQNGVKGGAAEFDLRLAQHLMKAIPFEADDHAVKRAIELALSTAVRTCRKHPDIDRGLTQDLLIDTARDNGIQIAMLEELGERMDQGFESVHGYLRELQDSIQKIRIFDNVLDFVVREGANEFRLEVSLMKDGKVCIFHNKPFNTDFRHIKFFTEDNQIVFVSEKGTMRDIGFPIKQTIGDGAAKQDQVLLIKLGANEQAEYGYYIPLKVYH